MATVSYTRMADMTAADLELHVSAFGHIPFPRATGVRGHRTMLRLTEVTEHDGLRVSSPAATWASLGVLPLFDLVALGDFFCRRWREGRGRPHPGRPPLSTIEDLRRMLEAGRRRGADRLRAALGMIREDAWSPRESLVRCILVEAGLPEPDLNTDVYDERGVFLGCVDLAYPREKVAIEYLGMLHGERWAQDVERLARLRAAGWAVIEVTSPLLKRPHDLVARVTAALKVCHCSGGMARWSPMASAVMTPAHEASGNAAWIRPRTRSRNRSIQYPGRWTMSARRRLPALGRT